MHRRENSRHSSPTRCGLGQPFMRSLMRLNRPSSPRQKLFNARFCRCFLESQPDYVSTVLNGLQRSLGGIVERRRTRPLEVRMGGVAQFSGAAY